MPGRAAGVNGKTAALAVLHSDGAVRLTVVDIRLRPLRTVARPLAGAALLAAGLFMGALAAPRAEAQPTFSLLSANCLHLGWSNWPYQRNKYQVLQGVFNGFDVSILQEVMRQANMTCALPGATVNLNGTCTAPALGNFFALVTPVQGRTTYREAYAAIVRNNFVVTGGAIQIYGGPLAFSRPPGAILLQSGLNWTWIANYHAPFGKNLGSQRAETAQMATVANSVANYFQTLNVGGQTYTRLVFGGDWNLNANDQGFNNLRAANFTMGPNVQTSLTPGGGLSQPYDHFAWSNNVVVQNARVTTIPITTGQWRTQVSDHLPIQCQVQY